MSDEEENWQVIEEKTGGGIRRLYYNRRTNQSTYDKPNHLKSIEELNRVRNQIKSLLFSNFFSFS